MVVPEKKKLYLDMAKKEVAEVEKQYKSLNRNLNYAWVDRMEKFQISSDQMRAFLKQGTVTPAEGSVR